MTINDGVRRQMEAVIRGFNDVFSADSLRVFSHTEVQAGQQRKKRKRNKEEGEGGRKRTNRKP